MIGKSTLPFFVFLLLGINTFAQKEGNIWYFGEGAALNFNLGCEILDTTENSMLTFEGCATISDAEGNLLFYTNGGGRQPLSDDLPPGSIWNRDHEVMYDMMGTEGGGFSSTQSSIIVKKPGTQAEYYVFTMDEVEAEVDGTPGRGFSYYEVDMSQNGGLGAVTNYEESLVLPTTERLTACLHDNQEDYWVIIYNEATIAFDVFSVSLDGVNLEYSQPLQPDIDTFNASITFRFSPNRELFFGGGAVFQFDAATGILSNPVEINEASYPAAFSPNSRYLYLTSLDINGNFVIVQYDLEAENIDLSRVEIANVGNGNLIGQFQVAPDGYIYFIDQSFVSGGSFVSAIKCPNSDAPCVEREVFQFPFQILPFLGLPNFTDHFFADTTVQKEIELCAEASQLQVCDGETATLSVNHYQARNFQWSTGETTASIVISEPGTYEVTVTADCCFSKVETFEILGNASALEIEITGNNTICPNGTVLLSLSANAPVEALWSTGSTESFINADSPGLYEVTATDACGNQETIDFEVFPAEELSFELPSMLNLNCNGSTEIILTTNADSIFWSTGDTTATIFVDQAGTYSVSLSDACQTITESVFVEPIIDNFYEMPNAFTPDGDGDNDTFGPIWDCINVLEYEMVIFNRWGQLVYSSENPEAPWDGSFNGKEQNADVYIYSTKVLFEDNTSLNRSGDVTLIR